MSEQGFFIGKTGNAFDTPLFYPPASLTTHAVILGMTGSGKTGLMVGLLEEAALAGIPSIILDPKGDLTNLLLHFPGLASEDFKAWIDPDSARRQGKTLDQLAQDTAQRWRNGLAASGLSQQTIVDLKNSVDFKIFTPGSSAGLPISLLSSFQSPGMDWDANREILREKIASTVTALLSLVGLREIDPLRSKEHILLSNIFETAWSSGHPLDFAELILQVQSPPFERLGAFTINRFFPENERLDLALRLNNALASPSFQTWVEGDPLDAGSLLYSPSGKPRHSILYLAHLDEPERMFFVTLLLAAVESWMRRQRGSTGLRALVAFDEVVGYLPPVANPPSRPVMLRLLKQARAFGLGMLLAAQNPVDLDYKALSNAGTWFIGRLQTEQDKQRLLEGIKVLQSAEGSLDPAEASRIISGLQPRNFLLHNVHFPGLQVFQTRWTMNYLAGPVTRVQIPALMRLISPDALSPSDTMTRIPENPINNASRSQTPIPKRPVPGQPWEAPDHQEASPFIQPEFLIEEVGLVSSPKKEKNDISVFWNSFSSTRPAVPEDVPEYFLPDSLGMSRAAESVLPPSVRGEVELQGLIYRASFIAQAEIHYVERKIDLDYIRKISVVLTHLDGNLAEWEDFIVAPFNPRVLDDQRPAAGTRYAPLPDWLMKTRQIAGLEKNFVDWVLRNSSLRIWVNSQLKLNSFVGETQAEFRERCTLTARDKLQSAQEKINQSYAPKLEGLQTKRSRQKGYVEQLEDKVAHLRTEQLGVGAEFFLGLFGGRKRSINTSLTKNRLKNQAENQLEQARLELENLASQVSELNSEHQADLNKVQEQWGQAASEVQEIMIHPTRRDIYLDVKGIAWTPYYVLAVEGKMIEARAFPLGEEGI